VEFAPPDHGRIETRKIWTTTELNTYLDFPHVGQAFVVEREAIQKKTGQYTAEIAYVSPANPRTGRPPAGLALQPRPLVHRK